MTQQVPLVLTVNSNRRNLELLKQFLEKNDYKVMGAASLAEVDQALQSSRAFSVALVDIVGFDRRIWDYCEMMHNADIPFFVISPKQSNALQKESLQYGARGVLVKPLVIKELLGLINSVVSSPENNATNRPRKNEQNSNHHPTK